MWKVIAVAKEDLPVRFDLRPEMSEVKDQGQRPTCLAFAITAAHEMKRSVVHNETLDLCEEVLYWAARQVDGSTQQGSTVESARAALRLHGQPDEQHWPYDPLRDDTESSYAPPPSALSPANCYRAEARMLQGEHSAKRIKHLLAGGTPVVLGMHITMGFLCPESGYVPIPDSTDELLGAHAVLAVGYDDDVNGAGYIIVRNSWGSEWGDNGYAYVPYEYIDSYLCAAAYIHKSLP